MVVDDTGAPVANAMVMLIGDPRASVTLAGGPAGEARTSASGQFVISGVASGSYTAMASLPRVIDGSGGSVGGFFGGGPSRPNQASITVNDANVDDVKIVVERPQ
jgi:hypothetical protein